MVSFIPSKRPVIQNIIREKIYNKMDRIDYYFASILIIVRKILKTNAYIISY